MKLKSIDKPELGQAVIVRWTNAGNQYQVPAVVDKINAKSIRVVLTEAVPSAREIGLISYPAGQSIIIPAWPKSTNFNGIFKAIE